MCVCVCVCVQLLSRVRFFASLWTVASQAPLSLEFSRQEYWSALPFPAVGGLPDAEIKPRSLMSSALVGGFLTTEPPLFSEPGNQTFKATGTAMRKDHEFCK